MKTGGTVTVSGDGDLIHHVYVRAVSKGAVNTSDW